MINISPILAGVLGLVCFIAAMCILAWMIGDAIGKNRRQRNYSNNSKIDASSGLSIKVNSGDFIDKNSKEIKEFFDGVERILKEK